MEAKMFEADSTEDAGRNTKRIVSTLTLVLAPIGILFCAGAMIGLWTAHLENGGETITLKMVAITAVIVALIAGLLAVIYRTAKPIVSQPSDLTQKERLNRNILITCCFIGGVIGVAMAILGFDVTDAPISSLANGPIPTVAALILAAAWGIFLPILAYYWHKRAIDEQEAAAYRDGAYYAAYTFIVAAPAWWFLARGGLVPEPNGVAIYFIFNLIWLSVWFYKKYA
jgi:hypothetical protein